MKVFRSVGQTGVPREKYVMDIVVKFCDFCLKFQKLVVVGRVQESGES